MKRKLSKESVKISKSRS